jgi:dipeptidyl aminopeptidase/acylaminoacyl peptidase
MGSYAHSGSKKRLLGDNPSQQKIEAFSTELQVSAATPPTFMVHALNDSTVPVRNSLLFYNSLIDKKVPASIHIFPQGSHAIKMTDNPGSADLFQQLLVLWLKEMKFLVPKNE